MKKNFKFILFFQVTFSFISATNAQLAPFTSYFCELDTQFNNQTTLSTQKLNSSAAWGSNRTDKSNTIPTGKISGAALNRSSNFKYFSDKSNIKTFNTAHVYTNHNFDSLGVKSSLIGKSEVTFNIGENLMLNKFSFIPFAADIKPRPIQLGKIELGITDYQSPNNRGNLFASEMYIKNNDLVYKYTKDTFSRGTSNFVITANFPSDNANYANIIGGLNSAECSGWLIEIDRTNNTFQNRRFDLGRAPRKSFIINSVRTTTSAAAAIINRSFQIIGEGLDILVKTELNNNVQEFSVYSEELNKYKSHWTLLNKLEGGSIQPLGKDVLIDLYNYIISNPELEFSYFLNVTDIKINDITNTLVIISSGGEMDINSFKTTNNVSHELIFTSNLSPLIAAGKVTDKLGFIMEIDGNDEFSFQKQGFITSTGKFVSNLESVTFHNLSYIDENLDVQSTSYAILSEKVFDNSLGQNPLSKKGINDFQNEVFLVDLKDVSISNKTLGLGLKNFQLFNILSNNVELLNMQFNETYSPYFSIECNNNSGLDSFRMVRGFAEYFYSPEECKKNSSVVELIGDVQTANNVIYPNPLNCQTGHCLLNLIQPDEVNIYSFNGQFIAKYLKDEVVDLGLLKSGLYLVCGKTGWVEKLIIQ